MSGYRRFVAYIYEYGKGEKGDNCGFVKVDMRNGVCRMQIHIQIPGLSPRELEIYGFVRWKEKCLGILLGEGSGKNGILEVRLNVPQEEIGESGYGGTDLAGLWIKGGDRENYITVWDEDPVRTEMFISEKPEEPRDQPAGEEESLQEEGAGEVQAEETPVPGGSLEERWQQFCYHYPEMDLFQDEELTQCLRIGLKDISFLGREEIPYCQNPYVRQGFLKFHHLLLGRHQSGRFVLGVPGIFRGNQDRQLARMYGFPEYKEVSQEKTEEDQLGYCYHFLS